MVPEDHNTAYKAGFVAVMGRPNVGKSTLINTLLEQKIAAVSPKPQTTRRRQLGILDLENSQIIFEDTPGVHRPRHKLGECMNKEALQAFEQADLILFMGDASSLPQEEDQQLARIIAEIKLPPPVILALNKEDLVSGEVLEEQRSVYQDLLPGAVLLPISAIDRQSLDVLLDTIIAYLPEHPPFFEDQVTDLYERDIAADLIREAALEHLQDEVPHSIAVRVDEYNERGEHGAYIAVTMFVERESQKGIVIGQNGTMIKHIGATARQKIEVMSGRTVFLELRVKVRKNWRDDEETLRLFGFKK
ncbi:MAG: GTPase Era [Anaerolineales bacterium]|nr:GTPase Era [Anaerolineales bacterium]